MSPGGGSRRDLAGRAVGGGPIGACPTCGAHEFVVLLADEEGDLLCTSCDRRWHYSMGFVTPADPPGPAEPSSGPATSAPSPQNRRPRSGRV
ncbi:MAG: hypothetical protein ACXWA9_03230 [Acidimicrobiia bacterium]